MYNYRNQRIEYPGCTEILNGIFVCEDDGSVYLHDEEGEICCWVYDEIIEEPATFVNAITAVALAAKMGVKAVRNNITDKGTTLGVMLKHTERVNTVRPKGR